MNRQHSSFFFIAFILGACGSGATTTERSASAGAETVVDPVGNELALDAAESESYERLAAELSSQELRVDHGSYFTHEASGRGGRMLIAAAMPLEVLEFDSTAEALAFADRISADGRLFDGEMMYPSSQVPVHVFAYRQSIVIFRGDDDLLLRSLDAIATLQTSPLDGDTIDQSESEVLDAVTAYLSAHELFHAHPLDLVAQERVTFTNACLDIDSAAEVCAEVQTPGWRLTFQYGEDTTTVHADRNASRIHVRE